MNMPIWISEAHNLVQECKRDVARLEGELVEAKEVLADAVRWHVREQCEAEEAAAELVASAELVLDITELLDERRL